MSTHINDSRLQAAKDRLGDALRAGADTGPYRTAIASLEATAAAAAEREAATRAAEAEAAAAAAQVATATRAHEIAGAAGAQLEVVIERYTPPLASADSESGDRTEEVVSAPSALAGGAIEAGAAQGAAAGPWPASYSRATVDSNVTSALQHAAGAVARAEVVLQQAEAKLTEARMAQVAISQRIAAKERAVALARSTRGERQLTDQEAAQLNLDVLDVADLQALRLAAASAEPAARTGVTAAAASLQQYRTHFDQLVAEQKVQSIISCAAELERMLCAALQEAFDTANLCGRRRSMRDLWMPSRGLVNVVDHNRCPKGTL